jgi:predicted esterase
MARRSYEKLISDENLVRYYPVEKLGHTVNLEQLDVMGDWIDDVLGVIRHVYQK